MNRDKWDYIRRMSEKHKARFIKCDGIVYEITKIYRPTGPSPQWSIEPVRPTEIEGFDRQADELQA
jgi:hypothetical protein